MSARAMLENPSTPVMGGGYLRSLCFKVHLGPGLWRQSRAPKALQQEEMFKEMEGDPAKLLLVELLTEFTL